MADRGFGQVGSLRFLAGLRRALGRRLSFVIRLPGKLEVEHAGRKRLRRE